MAGVLDVVADSRQAQTDHPPTDKALTVGHALIHLPDPTIVSRLLNEPDLITGAKRLAEAAHRHQVDKARNDYFAGHLTDVHARAVAYGADPDEQAAALLHDVVEDTAVTEENLLDLRFAPTTLLIVHLVTKRAGEPEQVYYARLRACELARRLKLDADIASNSDPARLALLNAPLRTRLTEEYDKARRRSRT